MQELSDSIKRPNLQIRDVEEGEVQAKVICNVFNKIIKENFSNLEKNDAHSGTGSLQDTKQT
jgi:hypothetical protein